MGLPCNAARICCFGLGKLSVPSEREAQVNEGAGVGGIVRAACWKNVAAS